MEYIPVAETGAALPCDSQYHTSLTMIVTPAKKTGARHPFLFLFSRFWLSKSYSRAHHAGPDPVLQSLPHQ